MANGKKTRKRIFIFGGAGLVLIILGVLVVLGSKRDTVLKVQVEKVSKRTITQVVTATGKIQPEVAVKISPEVSGEIVELPVKEGDAVKKGQLLMKIKPDFYSAIVNQAEAGLIQARANLTKSEAEFERVRMLYDKGMVSKSEYDVARAAYESSRGALAQSTASLDQARENLRKTTIVSPMDGTVSQLNSELGERVLGTVQFQGTDVMTIADLSRMEARVDVSENDVVLVSIGDTARIAVDAFPDRKIIGLVYEIANTATSKGLGTQEEVTNFEVKIRVVDKGVRLRPGMSMTADIETETKQNVLSVPIQSVTTRAPKPERPEGGEGEGGGAVLVSGTGQRPRAEAKPKEIVFVVDNGVAKAVEVKRGIANESYVEIVEGVAEGVEVVSGSYKAINRELEDGAKVRVDQQRRGAKEEPKTEGT